MRSFLFLTVALLVVLVAGPALANNNDPPRILVSAVQEKLNSGEDILFLDTRTDLSRATLKVKIPGAIQVTTVDILHQIISTEAKERLIVVYCT